MLPSCEHQKSNEPHRKLPAKVGLLLSGGLDSAILLGQLLDCGSTVQPFYVHTGCCWEQAERTAIGRYSRAIGANRLAELIVFEQPIDDLYGNHWSITGQGVPHNGTPDQAVYMPGRNPLLLLKPALWCQAHGIQRLALGTLDANPFADATPEFFRSFEEMLTCATGSGLRIERPLAHVAKQTVMSLGRKLPLHLTFSCLAPVADRHCGRCNKCAERAAAFRSLHRPDPTQYAVRACVPTM